MPVSREIREQLQSPLSKNGRQCSKFLDITFNPLYTKTVEVVFFFFIYLQIANSLICLFLNFN